MEPIQVYFRKMVIAQTNIQLYNQLRSDDWSEADLTSVRQAYDLSQKLFSNAYRPTQKPFVCHLIGVASVLAHWKEPPAMVIAGLLHSSYLYGKFGDKGLGVTCAKREYLRDIMGDTIENLIHDYSSSKDEDPLTSENRDFLVLSLADLYDELLDLGPVYAPVKVIKELSGGSADVIKAASRVIGPEAAIAFEEAIRNVERTSVLDCLTTSDIAFKRMKEGVSVFRNKRRKSILSRLLRKKN